MSRMNPIAIDLKQQIAGTVKAMVRANLPGIARKNRKYGDWFVRTMDGADNLKLHIVMEEAGTGGQRVFEVSIKEKKI